MSSVVRRLRQVFLAATITLVAASGSFLSLPAAPATADVASVAPLVGMAATSSGQGYWQVASDGGVFAFGDAGFYGSMGAKPLSKPVVGMAVTPSGHGYWEVAADGGVFSFGDAPFKGSMGGQALNAPVAGIAATPTGQGYWLTAADGGVFSFGDAPFKGSMGDQALAGSVNSLARTPRGDGYWMSASDGGVFSFGGAEFYGRATYTPPASPPPTSAANLATQILNNSNIDKSGRLVLTDLRYAAAGKPSTAGSMLSARLLQVIASLGNHRITVSALESGGSGHATRSLHYSGDAVDFSRMDGQPITGRNAPALTIMRSVAGQLPWGSAFGQSNCGATPALPPGVSVFPDSCDHLHVQVTRGTP